MQEPQALPLWQNQRFVLSAAICASVLSSLLLLAGRVAFTGTLTYAFLAWNLFLALVPFLISRWLTRNPLLHLWALTGALVTWAAFFPNAPYIFTDFVHLRHRAGVPFWFDLSLLSFFAWNGIMLGFISLVQVQEVVTRRAGWLWGWVLALGMLASSGFGVYLGRFLRWNSWDLVRSPFALAADVAESLAHPFTQPRAWGVTLTFALFLTLGYCLLRALMAYAAAQGSGLHPQNKGNR